MERANLSPRGAHISTYVNQRTGEVRSMRPSRIGLQGALSIEDDSDDRILDSFGASSFLCIRDRQTGELHSLSTRVHHYGGGFAVTKRRRVLPGQEEDGTKSFANSTLSREPHGILHRFTLNTDDSRDGSVERSVDVDRDPVAAPQYDDNDPGIDPSPTVAPANERYAASRNRRPAEKQLKLSDEKLLEETVALYKRRIYFLCSPSGSNPHIRIHHLYRKGRTFAYASAFLRSERGPTAILSVLWQTQTRPHWAVCVTFSLASSNQLVAHCTCEHLVAQEKGHQVICYHVDVLFENQDFIDFVKFAITRRHTVQALDEGSTLFGQCIDIERLGHNSHYLTVFLDRSEEQQKGLVRPWTFFMVLDVQMQIFVPVLKVYGKALQCMLCRTSSVRRGTCAHEDGCLAACTPMRSSRHISGILSDLGFQYEDKDNDCDTEVEDDVDSSENENDHDNIGRRNQTVRVPEQYSPVGFKRTILPCPGEQKYMKLLARKLQDTPFEEMLSFDDRNKMCCPNCGTKNTKPLYYGYRREVKLLTVAQGTRSIYVYDWYCDVCREKRNFTGRASGIFPATKKSCYTTELMYLLLEMSCMHGISFRAAYKITRLFSRTPTALLLLRSQGVTSEKDGKSSRRRASEAFRAFQDHLDTSSHIITNKLFSCEKCETPLTKQDCEELGVTEEEGRAMKRLDAVVIDGTAAGVLTKLPKFVRSTSVVPPASGGLGAATLVKQAKHRKLLGKFLEVSRTCLRQWKKRQSSFPLPSTLRNEDIRFWLHNPSKANVRGIETPTRYLTQFETQMTKLHISEDACFCADNTNERIVPEQHVGPCEDMRAAFAKTGQYPEVGRILRQMFVLSKLAPAVTTSRTEPGGAVMEDSMLGDAALNNQNDFIVLDEDYEGDDDEYGAGSDLGEMIPPSRFRHRIDGTCATLLIPNVRTNTQYAESVISLVHFLLLEHIAIPYVGRISVNTHDAQEEDDEGESSSMLSFTSTSFKLHDTLVHALEAYTSCMHFQEQGIAQNVPRECDCMKKFKLATISINEANPVLGMFCQEFLKLRRPLHITHSSVATSLLDLLNRHMEVAKSFFVDLKQNLSEDSHEYYEIHGSVEDSSVVGEARFRQSEANKLIREGSDSQEERSSTQREQTGTELQVSRSEQQVTQQQDASTEQQVDSFAESLQRLATLELEESKESGLCFPGRLPCRPCIVFQVKDHQSCSKKYNASRSHTPGLLTVQCTCGSPKLIGFVVMTQAESTALALSAILSHFGIPPRTVFYDNACNLFVSTLLRVPWLLGKTRLAVDRFHYKSHKCCAYFDPDCYRQFDMLRTETAESINARIGKDLNTIRYLNGKNLISFLRTRFTLLNLTAFFKQKFNRTDIEDEDMTNFFHSVVTCHCYLCKEVLETSDSEEREEEKEPLNE